MCMHFAICNFHLADKFEKISMTEEDRFSKVNGEQLLLEPSTGTGGKPQAGPGAGAGRAAVSAGVTGCSVQARAQRAADAAVLWAAAHRDSVLPLGKGRATPEGALATHRAGRTGRLLPPDRPPAHAHLHRPLPRGRPLSWRLESLRDY